MKIIKKPKTSPSPSREHEEASRVLKRQNAESFVKMNSVLISLTLALLIRFNEGDGKVLHSSVSFNLASQKGPGK